MNVVIAQSDLVTAYGWGIDALWNGLLGGETAIAAIDRFAERGFTSDQAAVIPDLEVDPNGSRVMAMLNRLLTPLIGKLDPMTPLILSTTVGEIDYVERSILQGHAELAAEARPQVMLARIKALLQLRGAGMVISSACASSSMAVTQAASLIRRGDEKAVLVVACDAVSEFVYSGFSTLHSLCAAPARPFDESRNGLTLGEAAAWALVVSDDLQSDVSTTPPTPALRYSEEPDRPPKPDSSDYLRPRDPGILKSPPRESKTSILGWGNTTDATHMTAPDRNAGGLSRAIGKACSMAKRQADEISFIAAHGTATIYSDAMEMLAFGNTIPKPKPVFSIKGGVGHTLATAGLLQILVAGRAISRGVVPATVGLRSPDPAAIDWAHTMPAPIGRAPLALSTNSGFGGVNTAILLGEGNQA